MALTAYDKTQINGLLRKNVNEVYYEDFFTKGKKSKYNDKDVLKYLLDLFFDKLQADYSTNNDYSVKYMYRLVYYILGFTNNCLKAENMDADLYIKLKDIEKKYQDFINNNEDKYDEDIDKIVKSVIEKVNHLSVATIQDIDVIKEEHATANKLAEYEKEIAKLKTDCETLTSRLEKAKKDVTSYKKKLEEQKDTAKELEQQITTLNAELDKKNKSDKTIQDTIEALKTELERWKQNYDKLNELYLKKCSELSTIQRNERERQRKEILESKKRNILEHKEKWDTQVERLLLDYLITNDGSIDMIQDYLSIHEIHISDHELYEHLLAIQKIVKIGLKKQELGKRIYGVQAPQLVPRNIELTKANGDDYLELLFISNLSLAKDSSHVIRLLNSLYDYCIKHNISYIYNIGNIFNFGFLKHNHADIGHIQEIIEKVGEEFPYDETITNIVLGGEKDALAFKAGIDSLDRFCQRRLDFINAGYHSSTLTIGDNKVITVHQTIDPTAKETIDNYLKAYYGTPASRDNNFLDVIGTTGISTINFCRNFIAVPAIRSFNLTGAYHVKVSLTPDIYKAIFKPLMMDKNVVATSHITYQKAHIKANKLEI